MTRARKLRIALVALALVALALLLFRNNGTTVRSPANLTVDTQPVQAEATREQATARANEQRIAPPPEPQASLSGILISARTQQPVAPGTVTATTLGENQVTPSANPSEASQQLVGVDANGRFVIRQLKPGRYSIEASATGYAHELRFVQVPSKTPLIFSMRDSAFISGKVVREDKTPVAGATVLAFAANEELSSVTSEGGGFSLEVAPGVHALFARAGSLSARLDAPIEVKPGQTVDGVVLILKAGTLLSGHVHNDAGEPIRDATVSLSLIAASHAAALSTDLTDHTGRYEFVSLTPGVYTVAATASGYAESEPAHVVITSSPSTIDLMLHGAAAVEGRVLDRDGAPIPEALVSIAGEPEVAVDASGHFLFENLPPGKTTLAARRTGQANGASKQVLLIASSTIHQDLTLGTGAILHGVVHYKSGGALDSSVRISAAQDGYSSGGETDPAGVYSITLEPGDYKVSARPIGWVSGFTIASGVPVTLAAGEDRELDLALPQDGPDDGIHGLVLEPGGAPSIKPLISAVIEGQGQRNFRAREDGTFDLPMPQLNGAAIALYAGNGGREGTGRADEQATHPIIQLLPAATLVGDVQRTDNQPVQTFTLSLTHPNDVMSFFIDQPLQLAGPGFVLDDVAPGAIHLVATTPDGSTGELDLQLQPGELGHAQIKITSPAAPPKPPRPQQDPRRRL